MSTDATQPSAAQLADAAQQGVSQPTRWLVFYGLVMAGFAYLSTQHVDGESYGVYSLLPAC